MSSPAPIHPAPEPTGHPLPTGPGKTFSVRWLKRLRVYSGLLFLGGLTVALAGATGAFPQLLGHWLASAQFVPAAFRAIGGGAAVLGLIGLVVLTLFIGRLYCSAICPLGVLQDVVARLANLFRKKPLFLRYAPPQTVIRQFFLWASIISIVLGWGGFALAVLDPYGNFGHLITDFIRPLIRLGLKEVSGWTGWNYHGIHRGEVVWASAGVLLAVSIIPAIVIILSSARGRLYCNSICPVGTLLGVIAKRGFLKIEFDKSACVKCADCLKSCKAQCIDLKSLEIDHSRCVTCFNCIDVCDSNAINLRASWSRKPAERPQPIKAAEAATVFVRVPPDRDRRAFLRRSAGAGVVLLAGSAVLGGNKILAAAVSDKGAADSTGKNSRVITPPGAISTERFLDICTACHLCISACPTRVLKPAFLEYGLEGLLKPHLDYSNAHCSYDCTACGDACPVNAITDLTLQQKHATRIGTAHLVAEKCRICMQCVKRCPTEAITSERKEGYYTIPVVNAERCIGCGICEAVCPTDAQAIKVTGYAVHELEPKLLV